MATSLKDVLDSLYRSESRKILATLIRLLGDFDLAEDALHEAFRAALEQWPNEGVPTNPSAWLISTGRFKGIDRQRKSTREVPLESAPDPAVIEVVADLSAGAARQRGVAEADDRLRLIFTCCHPDIPSDARAALTLREVCGLTTEEIARAFLATPAAIAQRIVRAKNTIREEHIPYEVPAPAELSARLDTVLQVIYLVFNEGYSASSGESLTRADLSGEAIRLGRLLQELLPEPTFAAEQPAASAGRPEVEGLLALMLLQESRRPARATADGDLILLEHQDRSLWNPDLIREGVMLVEHALRSRRFGAYTLQAAIAAIHAEALRFEATDWKEIAALYDLLIRTHPSPVVELNRAVAIAMRDGPAAGLPLVDDLLARGVLDQYHLIYSVRADLCRRLGKTQEARAAYQQALAGARQEPERRFLEKRLSELPSSPNGFPAKNRGE